MKTLIDAAARACGSRYKVAQKLGVDESNLAKMAAGKLTMPPRLAARLAGLAGLDPVEAAQAAVIESARTQQERDELIRLFTRAGVAAMSAIFTVVVLFAPSPAMASESRSLSSGSFYQWALYIMSIWSNRLATRLEPVALLLRRLTAWVSNPASRSPRASRFAWCHSAC